MTYEEYVEKYKDKATDLLRLYTKEEFDRWQRRISIPYMIQNN